MEYAQWPASPVTEDAHLIPGEGYHQFLSPAFSVQIPVAPDLTRLPGDIPERSPEEIQELLKKLDCDPIARMTKIAERAEKAMP